MPPQNFAPSTPRISQCIQWNCNGFYNKLGEITHIVSEFQPLILCIQETHLKPQQKCRILGYNCYRKEFMDGNRASGGVATFIDDSIYSENFNIVTGFQAVATKITIPNYGKIIVCNIYLPNRQKFNQKNLQDLINQLTSPYILVGDFNAHHSLWGGTHIDSRGKIIESLYLQNDQLVLLNEKAPTHLSMSSGTLSAIDLSFCSGSLAASLDWEVIQDAQTSDHFPISIRLLMNIRDNRTKPIKWIFHKADWPSFTKELEFKVSSDENETIADIDSFTNLTIRVAEKYIPKTKPNPTRKKTVPWWSNEIAEAIKNRKEALKIYQKYQTIDNFITFKRTRAKARQVVQRAKNEHWINYLNEIDSNTPSKKVWNTLKSLKNGQAGIQAIHLKAINNNDIISSEIEVAELFAEKYATASCTSNYSEAFQEHKINTEAQQVDKYSNNTEVFNQIFSMNELNNVIKYLKNSAPGPSKIDNQMVKHFGEKTKEILLGILNDIWVRGLFPENWSKAVIIPILKPGKQRNSIDSYRPVCLTDNLCKIMERLVKNRLQWTLDSNNLLNNSQNGFRPYRSTIDHLVQLENDICNAMVDKEEITAVFLDLEKAFDRCWKYKILKTLSDWNIKGRIIEFIDKFLSNRQTACQIGNTRSEFLRQENGTPQGSILSPTLFLIAINDITNNLPVKVKTLIYADDIVIYTQTKNKNIATQILQGAINNLEIWAEHNGHSFSAIKTKYMIFSRRNQEYNLNLRLNGQRLEKVTTHKFLGLILDSKLTWKTHLKELKIKCLRQLNLLRVVSNKNQGVRRQTLIKLYKIFVLSVLNYGSIIYGSARERELKKLDVIQNTSLRICIGAYHTCPIYSLHSDSGELPLTYKRHELMLKYYTKVTSFQNHPIKSLINNSHHQPRYAAYPRSPKPFIMRTTLLINMSYNTKYIHKIIGQNISHTPPWEEKSATQIQELTKFNKDVTPKELYKALYLKVITENENTEFIYTDGSKIEDQVGCAYIWRGTIKKFKLPSQCSSFTAELIAIDKAVDLCRDIDNNQIVICSDSKSSIDSLTTEHHGKQKNIINNIRIKIDQLLKDQKLVRFMWIPGHIGIHMNEEVDMAAKNAHENSNETMENLALDDIHIAIKNTIRSKWTDQWHRTDSKLKEIKDVTIPWDTSNQKDRRDEILITRLRTSHTNLTHSHILAKQNPPVCATCKSLLSVKHLIIECTKYDAIRKKNRVENTLKKALGNNNETLRNTLSFIRDIKISSKI